MPTRPPCGRRRGRLVGSVIAAVLAAGCGNGGDGGTNAEATPTDTTTTTSSALAAFLAADVQVRAEDIDFGQRVYRATAGEVTIGYMNEGRIFHTLELQTNGGDAVDGWTRLAVTEQGEVDVGTIALGTGEYTLYCDVAGHRAAGMEATLRVEE